MLHLAPLNPEEGEIYAGCMHALAGRIYPEVYVDKHFLVCIFY